MYSHVTRDRFVWQTMESPLIIDRMCHGGELRRVVWSGTSIPGIMAVDSSGATPIPQFVYSATSTISLPANAAVDKPLTTLSATLRADMLSLFATASTVDVVSTVEY